MQETIISSMQPMKYHIITWKLLGFWPPDHNPFWYHCYTFIIFLVPLISFPLLILGNLFSVNNLNDVIETLLPSSTVIIATIKGTLLCLNRSKIKHLFTMLHDMDMEVKSVEQKMIIQKCVQESQRLLKFVICVYYGGVTLAMVIAVIANEKMWPSWFPFNFEYHENLTMYYVVLLFQYISNMVHAVIDSTVDMYGSTFTKLLGCHLDVLGVKFAYLGIDKDKLNENDGNNFPQKQMNEMYSKNLCECVEYHTLCIRYNIEELLSATFFSFSYKFTYRFSQQLDEILSVHYLIQFSVSGFVLCVAAYQLSVV